MQAAGILSIAVALLLGACADEDCSLEHVVDDVVGTTAYIDCGHFEASAFDDAPHRAAHDCTRAAYSQQQDFAVRWYTPGIEGLYRHAYAGVNRAGGYTISELEQGYATDTTVLPTTVRSCTALLDQGACERPYIDLCFMCVFAEQHICEP